MADTTPTGPVQGRSIVAGRTMPPEGPPRLAYQFRAVAPDSGAELPLLYISASDAEVLEACTRAWAAYHELLARPSTDRAPLLEAIADAVQGLPDAAVTAMAQETGLGPARLIAERDRAAAALRAHAAMLARGDYARASIDVGEASRRPIPKPDLRRINRPIGPVAVLGSSAWPILAGPAGTDATSALAAGCPVIMKGHPTHPLCGEWTARVVSDVIERTGYPAGLLSFLHCSPAREVETARALVANPCVRAVAFTGTAAGAAAIGALAASRPDPIPVLASIGTPNPVFILPGAARSLADEVGARLAASVLNANGQNCTKPGPIYVPRGPDADTLARAIVDQFDQAQPQPMLSPRVRMAFAQQLDLLRATPGVELRGGSPQAAHRTAAEAGTWQAGTPVRSSPALYRASGPRAPILDAEVFGPATVISLCEGAAGLIDAAVKIRGVLTATIWADPADQPLARQLQTILEQRCGRLIFNAMPTGIEPCPSIVHGGPPPASTAPSWSSLGADSALRWVRPVCYQNAPERALPTELHNSNPLGITRLVNGQATTDPIQGRKAA